MTMENYYKRDNGRLEFSSEQKNNSDLNMVLDLSRKKSMTHTPTLPEINTNQIIDSSQILSAHIKKRFPDHFLDQVTQTPIAGSSAMLSPYSESNSPKRMKNESVNHYENSSQLTHTATLTNIHDITPGITMITPQQPSLHVFPNEVTNIPVAIPTISIPYMETSQSFITANEARRKISVPAECSTSTDMKPTSSLDTMKKPLSRPFKAYPNNILSIASTINHDSTKYAKYRQSVLEQVKKNSNTPNPKMRRVSKSPGLPTSTVDEKDAAYWERRRKNNEAAKRSRDARRAKEDELAIRAGFLEQENKQLRYEIQELKKALIFCKYNLQHQDNLV